MLPDVKLAFDIVNGYFASDEPSAITDAWEILKAAVLAQQTTNTGSPKLPQCTFCNHEILSWIERGYNYCPHCGRQLRANA
jgi:hypothetical protein